MNSILFKINSEHEDITGRILPFFNFTRIARRYSLAKLKAFLEGETGRVYIG